MRKAVDATHSRAFSHALIEAAPDAIVVADAGGRILLWNARAEAMFGYSREEIIDKPVELLMPMRFRAAHAAVRAGYASSPAVRPMGSRPELFALRRDGTEFPVEISLSPFEGEFGRLTIAIVRDISDRQRIEEKLRYLSGHDTLTGLYNRHMFEEQRTRLARGRQFPVSIVVADLDGLKEINDVHGHAAGDEMLRRAAALLVKAFRADDTVARIGGDEFAALLPSTGREAVAAALDRVRRFLRDENATEHGLPLRLSIGAATAEDVPALARCLREADDAMYRNKLARSGRVRSTREA